MITGGTVEGIQINPNESGLTRFMGGAPCAILPAGYLGSTLIGGFLVFTGFSEKFSRWSSIALCVMLFAVVRWAEFWYTRVVAVSMMAFLLAVFFYRDGAWMRWVILLMGYIPASNQTNLVGQFLTDFLYFIKGNCLVEFGQFHPATDCPQLHRRK